MNKKLELVIGIVSRILIGVLIGLIVVYIEFVVWRDYTELDVLYLVGFHAVVGNWIMLVPISIGIESATKFAKRWRARQSILKKYKRG